MTKCASDGNVPQESARVGPECSYPISGHEDHLPSLRLGMLTTRTNLVHYLLLSAPPSDPAQLHPGWLENIGIPPRRSNWQVLGR